MTTTNHPAFTDAMAQKMATAWAKGRDAAKALRPGHKFVGAYGAAQAAGLDVNRIDGKSFVTGFLSALARPIVTRGHDDLTLIQIGDRHLTVSREARFWVFLRSEPIKIKLRKGQTLRHVEFATTDEGYNVTTRTWHFDGETVTIDWCRDGRDCDGRLTTHGVDTCHRDKLTAGYRSPDEEPGVAYPLWTIAKSGQRDYAAEAAGY